MRNKFGGWEYGLSPDTINNFRQNCPELVIHDARRMLLLSDNQLELLRKILLARGVNKWLKARRDIITLKHETKTLIKKLSKEYNRDDPTHRECMKLLVYMRTQLREICHQERWVEWPKTVCTPSRAYKQLVIKGKKA